MRASARNLIVPLSIIFLAGCSTTSAEPLVEEAPTEIPTQSPAANFPEDIAPIVNDRTGELSPGSANFVPSFYDENNLANIVEQVKFECREAEGYDGDQSNWSRADSTMKARSFIGVWRVEDAEKHAFVNPMLPIDKLANSIVDRTISERGHAKAAAELADVERRVEASIKSRSSAEYKTAEQTCQGDPDSQHWMDVANTGERFGGPWLEEFYAAVNAAYSDPRMAAIKTNYSDCLEDSGYRAQDPSSTVGETFFDVEGMDYGRIDGEQIEMALAAVECKKRADAIEGVMSIVAEYEAPVYAKYQDELDSRAVDLANLLSEADAFWDAREN